MVVVMVSLIGTATPSICTVLGIIVEFVHLTPRFIPTVRCQRASICLTATHAIPLLH